MNTLSAILPALLIVSMVFGVGIIVSLFVFIVRERKRRRFYGQVLKSWKGDDKWPSL